MKTAQVEVPTMYQMAIVALCYCAVVSVCAAAEPPKQATPPSDAGKQVQEPPASAGMLEKDWLYQAERTPLAERTLQEITWAREIAARMSKVAGAPDLRAELAQLDQLEAATKLATAAPSTVKLPDGLVGRWLHYQLDGEGLYSLNVGAKPAALATGNYTLCAWIRTTKSSGDVIGNGASAGCFLLSVYSGVARAQHWPAKEKPSKGMAVIDGKTRVDDGQWHHVAQVVKDATLSVVVDGKLEGSVAILGTKVASQAPVTIGARGGDALAFAGTLDEICVFDRALSVEEIGATFRVKRELEKDPSDPSVRHRYFAVRQIKRQILFKHPAIDFTQVLYIDQPMPGGGTWWSHETLHRNGYTAKAGGRLMVLDGLHPGGKLRQIGPTEPAAYWRPDLSFDARKVLFCMKPAAEQSFHLYEINLDGSGLRQLTNSLYDDLDPIYLPDGHIMFVSSRCNTYIRCMPEAHASVLARCDGDGRNIYLISRNSENDFLPSLLNDGRVIYSRWEYTDKPLWNNQKLWTINPDGTGEAVSWGSQSTFPDHTAMPRPIPNSPRVMFAGVGHHNWFSGSVGIINPNKGLNYPHGLTRVTWDVPWAEVGAGPQDVPESPDYHSSGKFAAYQTPWPLSEELFLVSVEAGPYVHYIWGSPRGKRGPFNLYLMDVHGNRELIMAAQHQIFHAMPVKSRSYPVLPDRVAWPGTGKDSTPARPGVLYSADVCQGVPQLPRESVKFLRILQQDAKTYSSATVAREELAGLAQGPVISGVQDDAVKRILGTVPIAADGSVAFEVPAGKAVFFQLLDDKGRALQTMRSFTGVMPGEIRGCMGCHEQQQTAEPPLMNSTGAYRFKVSPVTPPPWGTNTTVSFNRFVQPVLDKHCGKCHQGDGEARKKLDLTSRAHPKMALQCSDQHLEPYMTLVRRGDMGIIPVEDRRYRSYTTIPPMTYLSYKSRLIEIAMGGKHHDVKIEGTELQQLIAWVDCVGPLRGEEEVRDIPDPKPTMKRPIPLLTKTAPVIDRFNIPQDPIPERDTTPKKGSQSEKTGP